jgi:hypothetical protein
MRTNLLVGCLVLALGAALVGMTPAAADGRRNGVPAQIHRGVPGAPPVHRGIDARPVDGRRDFHRDGRHGHGHRHDGDRRHGHKHFHGPRFHGSGVVIWPSPVYVAPARCYTPGYWSYQWVPQAGTTWVPGHWSPEGTWVDGHYRAYSTGYYQPVWVEGTAYVC